MNNNFSQAILMFLMFIPILSFHEAAHAWVADKLGDMTPRSQGRLTLNPIAHIDLFGTILIPFIAILSGFTMLIGWGKPVIIDASQFRNWRRDDTLVALAGPASNMILATIVLFVCRWLPYDSSFRNLGETFAFLSIFLGVFNLIPIPPLDGWHPIKHLFRIPEEFYFRYSLYWYIALLILIQLRPVMYAIFGLSSLIMNLIQRLVFY